MTFDEAKEIVKKLVADKESWKKILVNEMFVAFATCLYYLLEENKYEDNDKSRS